ncbi:MAG TPA: DUF5060 domain-containing protein [Candidatus Acidoferrales bacterium]|jgi:hypothetical protein|nr:DUF5060 domain-containing protein [Candidatus Acidoferrales bacterium]
MRNKLLSSGLIASTFLSWNLIAALPHDTNSVEEWGIYEIALNGPTNGNPFMDVQLSAVFGNGDKQVDVPGFYDGDGIYRIRFMPDTQGQWHYVTHGNVWPLTGKTGEFMATPPAKGNHGPVRVHDTYHFTYADGTPFYPIGTTIYNWIDAPESVQEETLKTLAASPFNKARMLVTQQPTRYREEFTPPLWPYAGTPPHDWDLTRFNPEFFQHYEKRIGQLRDFGIQADLILFNPYGKWGFNTMTAAEDDNYVRYVAARLSAYRNVWWCLANEFDFIRTKTDADWDRMGSLLQHCDPYNHLRSIHNGSLLYDYGKSWVTHVCIQNGVAVQTPGSAELYRDAWHKPVIYDEVKYEGDNKYRWADLSAREMTRRFWCGIIGGTYVTHGDYFTTVDEDTWTSFGGKMSGHSVPRIAFLKKILEDAPADGLDPVDKWNEPNIAGQAGKYYLIYFGEEAPTNWVFQLYKEGLKDGMTFKVDIIDTWDMTITPVRGKFITKKTGPYYFNDENGGSVSLSGRTDMALRIRRLGK